MLPSFALWSSCECQGRKGLCLGNQRIPALNTKSGAPQAAHNSLLAADSFHLHPRVVAFHFAGCLLPGRRGRFPPAFWTSPLSQWACNDHFFAIMANTDLTLALISLQSPQTLIHTRIFVGWEIQLKIASLRTCWFIQLESLGVNLQSCLFAVCLNTGAQWFLRTPPLHLLAYFSPWWVRSRAVSSTMDQYAHQQLWLYLFLV